MQVKAFGESLTWPEELDLLWAGSRNKGFALESTPNCAVSPLREINATLRIVWTTLDFLCQLQKECSSIDSERKAPYC